MKSLCDCQLSLLIEGRFWATGSGLSNLGISCTSVRATEAEAVIPCFLFPFFFPRTSGKRVSSFFPFLCIFEKSCKQPSTSYSSFPLAALARWLPRPRSSRTWQLSGIRSSLSSSTAAYLGFVGVSVVLRLLVVCHCCGSLLVYPVLSRFWAAVSPLLLACIAQSRLEIARYLLQRLLAAPAWSGSLWGSPTVPVMVPLTLAPLHGSTPHIVPYIAFAYSFDLRFR